MGTGKSVALPCRSSSLGIVRTWTDTDGRAIDSSGHRDILPNGDLLLTQVSWSDMGSTRAQSPINLVQHQSRASSAPWQLKKVEMFNNIMYWPSEHVVLSRL